MRINGEFHVAGSNNAVRVLTARSLSVGPLFRYSRLRFFALRAYRIEFFSFPQAAFSINLAEVIWVCIRLSVEVNINLWIKKQTLFPGPLWTSEKL